LLNVLLTSSFALLVLLDPNFMGKDAGKLLREPGKQTSYFPQLRTPACCGDPMPDELRVLRLTQTRDALGRVPSAGLRVVFWGIAGAAVLGLFQLHVCVAGGLGSPSGGSQRLAGVPQLESDAGLRDADVARASTSGMVGRLWGSTGCELLRPQGAVRLPRARRSRAGDVLLMGHLVASAGRPPTTCLCARTERELHSCPAAC